jgi:hypothetical protein
MIEDLLYDEKFWIMMLVVLFIIFVLGILPAMLAVVAWLIFLWWNKYKSRLPPIYEE